MKRILIILACLLGFAALILILYFSRSATLPKREVIKDESACTAKGGEWVRDRVGSGGGCVMVTKTKDANKPCLGNEDCEGTCLAPEGERTVQQEVVGRCSDTDPILPGGCIYTVQGGRVRGLCSQ